MRQPAYHQILPMILMTILMTSISLAKCHRVISKHGQEGITGDVITQLAKHGRVSITKDGNVTSNRYEGAPIT
jgi:hypothetical protein